MVDATQGGSRGRARHSAPEFAEHLEVDVGDEAQALRDTLLKRLPLGAALMRARRRGLVTAASCTGDGLAGHEDTHHTERIMPPHALDDVPRLLPPREFSDARGADHHAPLSKLDPRVARRAIYPAAAQDQSQDALDAPATPIGAT
jgi:hypothetical protein